MATCPWVDKGPTFITGTIKFEQPKEAPPKQMPGQPSYSGSLNRGQGGSSKRAGLGYDSGSNRDLLPQGEI